MDKLGPYPLDSIITDDAKTRPDKVDEDFQSWYKSQERRFYTGHMNTDEIAQAAWNAAWELYQKRELNKEVKNEQR